MSLLSAERTVLSDRWLLLFGYCGIVFMYCLWGFDIPFPLTTGDAENYLGFATNVVHHGAFSFNNIFMAIGPPGYPLTLLPAVYFANGSIDALLPNIVLTNGLWYAQLLFIAYTFLRRREAALCVSLFVGTLICLTPGAFQYTQDIMTESMFLPLMGYCFLLIESRLTVLKASVLCGLFTLMLLTKPIGLIPVSVFIIFMWIRFTLQDDKTRSLLLALFLTSILPVLSLYFWLKYSVYFGDFHKDYPGGYGAAVIETLTHRDAFLLFIKRLVNLFSYTLFSTFFLPLLLIIPRIRAAAFSKSECFSTLMLWSLWIFSAAIAAIAQAVFFENPEDGHFYLYGRYIEGLIPLVFMWSVMLLVKNVSVTEFSFVVRDNIEKSIILACVVFIILAFPYSYWRGLSAVGLSPAIYSIYQPESYLIPTTVFAVFFALLLFGGKFSKVSLPLIACFALSIQFFGAVKEMERVNQFRPIWKGYVVDRDFYKRVPPESIDSIVVVTKGGIHPKNNRFIYYLRPIYLKARFYFRDQIEGKLSSSSLVIKPINKAPKGFEFCGNFAVDLFAFCHSGKKI